MRVSRALASIFSVIAVGQVAQGAQQTPREAAVAIDRVEIAAAQDVIIERIAGGLRRPWSLAFLSDRDILVTEKHGGIRLIRAGRLLPHNVSGGPSDVYAHSDSGLLDIVLDSDFSRSRLVYLAFAQGTEQANRVAIWRARMTGDRLVDGRVIFRTASPKAGAGHPGGRMLFLPDGTLLLAVGDGFDYRDAAQDPGSHLGKVLRLTRDGAPAPDNPFIGRPGTLPEIWTLGHRNIQGLVLDPRDGRIWAHEHGPRGGDELNLLRAGANYGWPAVTHGINYDGTIISERAFAVDFERSHFIWSPSIAPSGLAIYQGGAFPAWRGQFLVGALIARGVIRLRIGQDTGLFVEEQRMLSGLGARIRDVRVGPDGLVYLLTDADNGDLLRVRPSR